MTVHASDLVHMWALIRARVRRSDVITHVISGMKYYFQMWSLLQNIFSKIKICQRQVLLGHSLYQQTDPWWLLTWCSRSTYLRKTHNFCTKIPWNPLFYWCKFHLEVLEVQNLPFWHNKRLGILKFCTFWRLKFTKLTKFRTPKMATLTDLQLLDPSKLLSRKIWMLPQG